MKFEEVMSFKVESIEDFNTIIDLFKNTDKDERLKVYEDISKQRGISLAEAKNEILKNSLSNFIIEQLENAIRYANYGAQEDAYKQVQFLKKIEPIFKEYDVNNHTSFIADVDPKITELEAGLLTYSNIFDNKEIIELNAALEQALQQKRQVVTSESEYLTRLLGHPILKCLKSYKNTEALIDNIENDVLDIGYYKSLILAVLKQGLDLSNEEHQRCLFFIINEDIKNNGLYNVYTNEDYEPKIFRSMIKAIINGESISNYAFQELSNQVTRKYTEYACSKNGEIELLSSSNKSLMDSGFHFKPLNLFIHLHTAQDSGNNQNSQHANTDSFYQKNGYQTLGVSITQKQVIELKTGNDYLAGYFKDINFNLQERIWLTQLQFISTQIGLIANKELGRVDENGNLENPDDKKLTESFHIAKTVVLTTNEIELSLELANIRAKNNDLQNIVEEKNTFFDVLDKNELFITEILKDATSQNEKRYQHIAKPILTMLESILTIEDNLRVNIFNEDEIKKLEKLSEIKSINADVIASLHRIRKDLKRRDTYENNVESTDNIQQWRQVPINRVVDHWSVIKNRDSDVIDYFIKNPFKSKKYSEKEIFDFVNAFVERLEFELKGLFNEDKVKKIINLAEDLSRGNVEFAKGDYMNYKKSNEHILANLVRDKHPTNQQKKSQFLIDRDVKVLNLLGIMGVISDSKMITTYHGYIVNNPELNKKLKIK